MIAVVLLGLALVVFFFLLANLFFQINSMEKRLDDALKNAEIYLLREFGEVTNDAILKSGSGQSNNRSRDEDDD